MALIINADCIAPGHPQRRFWYLRGAQTHIILVATLEFIILILLLLLFFI